MDGTHITKKAIKSEYFEDLAFNLRLQDLNQRLYQGLKMESFGNSRL